MKILVDCRCLNYPFLTGVNAYTIRLLKCLEQIKNQNPRLKITAMGLKNNRMRELMSQFPFLLDLFESCISLAQYQNYQDSVITQSNWFHKLLEVKLVTQSCLDTNLNNNSLEKYDYIILPQPRLLKLNPDSKLITIFHDIFSILDKQNRLPQSIIFNKQMCQQLVNRSHKVIAGSVSTCQDINKTFFAQTNFTNPKILLIYPALPNLQQLEAINIANKTPAFIDKELQCLTNKDLIEPTEVKFKIPTRPYILAISGIEPRKNWQNLLLAHKYLQDKYNLSLTLVLSGSIIDQSYQNRLLRLIQTNKIQNVVWIINPNEQQKKVLIEECEFVLYPSYYEGFGFPILEAFEQYKAVIASRISSMPEIGNGACVYVNPYNYISIANGIYILFTDKKFKKGLESEISKIRTKYSWNEMEEKLKQILV